MTRASKPAPRHASKRVGADPIVGWVEKAIRLTVEVDAEADAISARYEAACPDEYRFGEGYKYRNPGEFPADLQARYRAFNRAMGMGYSPDAPTDPRLTTAWRLEDKVREMPAKTLAGLLAKLRLGVDLLRRDPVPDPLTVETAYRWKDPEREGLPPANSFVSIWADAERLIGKGGAK
jgi:hypothetical protein